MRTSDEPWRNRTGKMLYSVLEVDWTKVKSNQYRGSNTKDILCDLMSFSIFVGYLLGQCHMPNSITIFRTQSN